MEPVPGAFELRPPVGHFGQPGGFHLEGIQQVVQRNISKNRDAEYAD